MGHLSLSDPTTDRGSEGSPARLADLLTWLPSGLMVAASLAVGRTLGRIAAAERSIPGLGSQEREIMRWETIGGMPDQLVQGLVLGLVAAALADSAVRESRTARNAIAPFFF